MEIDRSTIESILECVMCKHYLRPPVYSCAHGHSICSHCMITVSFCPLCLMPISSTFSRNFILEDILRSVLMECQNSRCQDCVSLYSLSDHLSSCPDCQELTCIEGCGNLHSDLPDHLVSKHAYHLIEMTNGERRLFVAPQEAWQTETTWPQCIWKLGEVSLLVRAKVSKQQFHIFLFCIGRTDVKIRIKIPSTRTGSIEFRGKIPHLRSILWKPNTLAHLASTVQELEEFYLVPAESDSSLKQLPIIIKILE